MCNSGARTALPPFPKVPTTMPSQLPLFPLGTVLFPGMPLPLRIFEQRYLRMLADRRDSDPVFGVILIKSGLEVGTVPQVSSIGTTARLEGCETRPDGTLDVSVVGVRRFGVQDIDWTGPYGMATAVEIEGILTSPELVKPLLEETGALFNRFVSGVAALYGRRFGNWSAPPNAATAVYDLASRLPLHTWERQAILEDPDTFTQLQEVNRLVRRELALLKAGTGGRAVNHPGGLFTSN